MARGKPTKLPIDTVLFSMAFERDVDFHDAYPQSAYLDKETGEIHWVYEDDEDAESEVGIAAAENAALRRRIAEAPERFLEIPGRTHGEHHDLLREFLASQWTEDESLRERAQLAYFGSIGGWKDAVRDQEIIHAFYDFRERRLREMREAFLKGHAIDALWK